MIKVEALEKADKDREKMTSKKKSQKMSEDIKPRKAFKPPKMPKMSPEDRPVPKQVFTEYRTLITPLIAGVAWLGYKQVAPNPTNDDYAIG